MKVYKINIADVAKQDIRDIKIYITNELQEPVTAMNITNTAISRICTVTQ